MEDYKIELLDFTAQDARFNSRRYQITLDNGKSFIGQRRATREDHVYFSEETQKEIDGGLLDKIEQDIVKDKLDLNLYLRRSDKNSTSFEKGTEEELLKKAKDYIFGELGKDEEICSLVILRGEAREGDRTVNRSVLQIVSGVHFVETPGIAGQELAFNFREVSLRTPADKASDYTVFWEDIIPEEHKSKVSKVPINVYDFESIDFIDEQLNPGYKYQACIIYSDKDAPRHMLIDTLRPNEKLPPRKDNIDDLAISTGFFNDIDNAAGWAIEHGVMPMMIFNIFEREWENTRE